jgi:hypothetical protein
MRFALALLLLTAACGDSSSPPADMAATFDMTFKSNCGKPGDPGNSIGIGKFCEKQSMCNPGTVCTQIQDPDNYFCTKLCTAGDAGAADCGENAHCACDPMGRGCGCFPDACN